MHSIDSNILIIILDAFSLIPVIVLNVGLSSSEDVPAEEDDFLNDLNGFWADASRERTTTTQLSTHFYVRVPVGRYFEKAITQPFLLQGVRFFIQISKRKAGKDTSLAIFIWIHGEDKSLDGRKLHATFRAVSTGKSKSVDVSRDIRWSTPQSVGFDHFMPYDEFQNSKNGFVKSQKALFEFSVSIDAPFPLNHKCIQDDHYNVFSR